MLASSENFDSFAAQFQAGNRQLVSRVLVADTQTPVSAYLKLAGDKPNCFLLESGRRWRSSRPVLGDWSCP
jgi:anthranilate synthase component 1